jgi:hypothetical protein
MQATLQLHESLHSTLPQAGLFGVPPVQVTVHAPSPHATRSHARLPVQANVHAKPVGHVSSQRAFCPQLRLHSLLARSQLVHSAGQALVTQ